MQFRRYTKKQLIESIKNSYSIAQTLKKLNVAPRGGNYRVINSYIKQLDIDTSHFTGKLWNKGKIIGPKRPIQDYFDNKCFITSHKLRKRLISEGIFLHQCMNCKLIEWFDKIIPLELHHINGDDKDNAKENLSLLCPNCHALTDNYRGKNIGRGKEIRTPMPCGAPS